MKLHSIRLSNFQSFGEAPTVITFEDVTYLIGPNGSGKTAVLQALCRLFAFDPSLRRIKRSDFHVPADEDLVPEERNLWLEADFEFPELMEDEDNSSSTITGSRLFVGDWLGHDPALLDPPTSNNEASDEYISCSFN